MYVSALLICIASVVVALPTQNVSPKGNGVLVEIGVTGNKIFYEIDEVPKINWMAAKDLCAIHGLDFGITENFDEFEFVYRNRMGKVKSTGIWYFWIGASQKGVLNEDGQSSYDTAKSFEYTNGVPVSSGGELGINFYQSPSEAQCLFASGDHHTYVDNCIVDLHYTLCQKTVS